MSSMATRKQQTWELTAAEAAVILNAFHPGLIGGIWPGDLHNALNDIGRDSPPARIELTRDVGKAGFCTLTIEW